LAPCTAENHTRAATSCLKVARKAAKLGQRAAAARALRRDERDGVLFRLLGREQVARKFAGDRHDLRRIAVVHPQDRRAAARRDAHFGEAEPEPRLAAVDALRVVVEHEQE